MNYIGDKNFIESKYFYIGRNYKTEAAIIYMNNLVNRQVIVKEILDPLMLRVDENIGRIREKAEYLCKTYIISSSVLIEQDFEKAVIALENGSTILFINKENKFLIIGTQGGVYRQLSDPPNESSIKGSREGFIENIDTNISIIKRNIKDQNLVIENFAVGRRSQTRLAVMFIDDIADRDIFNELKKRINAIDIDFVTASGIIDQFIEEKTYSLFPQAFNTERPDRVIAGLMEGKIAILVDGNPSVLTVPTGMHEFFNTVEDYYNRTVTASSLRLLRNLAVIIVLAFPSLYLVLIKFNSELIPVQLIQPIVQSRSGISLTPFMEIITLQIIVEFLREGGLRLPSKIAQTLSIVGGIILGDAAVKSNMVSPTTLLVVAITVVASFLIPNYEMSISLRLISFIIMIISNYTGIFGVSVCFIFILTHLSSLESLGVPYLTFYKNDMKDIFIRAPLWQMNSRPTATPNKNSTRQADSRNAPDSTSE